MKIAGVCLEQIPTLKTTRKMVRHGRGPHFFVFPPRRFTCPPSPDDEVELDLSTPEKIDAAHKAHDELQLFLKLNGLESLCTVLLGLDGFIDAWAI